MQMIHKPILILIAAVLIACRGEGPTGADVQTSAELAAHRSADAPADTSSTPDSTTADPIQVDLAGSSFRLVNTSGGELIAINKQFIIIPEWKIRAWQGSDTLSLVDLTASEWHTQTGADIASEKGVRWFADLKCGTKTLTTLDFFYQGGLPPFTGEPFTVPHCCTLEDPTDCNDEPLTLTIENRVTDEDETSDTWGDPILGGGMVLRNNTFPLSETLRLFIAPTLWIHYHPVAADSADIVREQIWLDAIVEERNGYWPDISRTLPFQNQYAVPYKLGPPVVVPVPHASDRVVEAALDSLLSQYRWNKTRVETNYWGGEESHLRVAVVSKRVSKQHNEENLGGGVAYLGANISAVYYYTGHSSWDRYESIEQSTLIHELGHNFGMLHTWDDENYPLYPAWNLDLDGWRIHSFNQIERVDRNEHHDIMAVGFRPWVSHYTWSSIVSFLYPDHPAVRARAVVSGRPRVITWNHDH